MSVNISFKNHLIKYWYVLQFVSMILDCIVGLWYLELIF